jgi:hypothetical protein
MNLQPNEVQSILTSITEQPRPDRVEQLGNRRYSVVWNQGPSFIVFPKVAPRQIPTPQGPVYQLEVTDSDVRLIQGHTQRALGRGSSTFTIDIPVDPTGHEAPVVGLRELLESLLREANAA